MAPLAVAEGFQSNDMSGVATAGAAYNAAAVPTKYVTSVLITATPPAGAAGDGVITVLYSAATPQISGATLVLTPYINKVLLATFSGVFTRQITIDLDTAARALQVQHGPFAVVLDFTKITELAIQLRDWPQFATDRRAIRGTRRVMVAPPTDIFVPLRLHRPTHSRAGEETFVVATRAEAFRRTGRQGGSALRASSSGGHGRPSRIAVCWSQTGNRKTARTIQGSADSDASADRRPQGPSAAKRAFSSSSTSDSSATVAAIAARRASR